MFEQTKKTSKIILLAIVFCTGLFVIQTRAATAVVTRTDDRNLTIANCPTTAGTIDCSLREAITFVNSNPGADTIQFAQFGMNVTLTLGELFIGATLTINGANSIVRRAPTAPEFRIFRVGADSLITINNLSIQNGSTSSGDGGGILIDSGTPSANLTLNTCTLSGNQAAVGGGISNRGNLTLNATSVRSNTALEFGGGIYNNGGTVTANNSAVGFNLARRGGGIENETGGALNLNNSQVSQNRLTQGFEGGGGISVRGGTVMLTNGTTVNANTIPATINGSGGGGGIQIFSGTVTLDNAAVLNNRIDDPVFSTIRKSGGGIQLRGGKLNLLNSRIENNAALLDGGGISIEGSGDAVIANTIISGNRSNIEGGGIFSASISPVSISNSSINGNTAANTDFTQGSGGGVFVSAGSVGLVNTTISGNTAGSSGGGILITAGSLSLTNCTVSNNNGNNLFSGGVFSNTNSTRIRNSIIAGNAGGRDVQGAFTSHGNNLIGNRGTAIGFGAGGDIVGTSANPVDARLRPLGFYGGATQTQPPYGDSPALDAGNNCVLIASGCGDGNPAITTDQRGRTRIGALADSIVDMGAVELQTGMVFDGGNAGVNTLRDRVSDPTLERILFFSSVSQVNLTSEIVINRPLEIIGNGATQTRISGQNLTRVFRIDPTGDVLLANLQITQGNSGAGDGGGILNQGKTRLAGCIFSVNRTTGIGGGLQNVAGATASVEGCAFLNNQANIGGAISSGGTLDVSNSTLNQNNAAFGAGINVNNGTATLVHNTIAGNTSTTSGGGIRNTALAVNFNAKNTIVAGNDAPAAPDAEGFFTSNGNNLIGKTDGSTGFTDGANGDIAGTIAAPVPANLLPFGNYGGNTFTMPPSPASRAINAGNNTGIASFDQRGVMRNLGGTTDIGAVEYHLSPVGVLQPDGTRSLPNATITVNYSQQLQATGGDDNFTFAVTAGSLPPGITVSQPIPPGEAASVGKSETPGNEPLVLSTATLSGTPTANGTYQFTITASNAANPNLNVSNNYKLVVMFPTAANVSIGGRVVTADGRGIPRARVSLADASGGVQTVLTNPFGYFRFDDLTAGETYLLAVRSKRHQFEPRVVTAFDDVTDLQFVALPQGP